MLTQEMLDLKTGDQVRYIGELLCDFPEKGALLTRKKEWLDDNHSVYFTYVDSNGERDYHFFTADEIEFIKE